MTWWVASWMMGTLRASVVGAFALALAVGARRNGPAVGAGAGLAGLIAMTLTFALSFAPWPQWGMSAENQEPPSARSSPLSSSDRRMNTRTNAKPFVRASDAPLTAKTTELGSSGQGTEKTHLTDREPEAAAATSKAVGWLRILAWTHLIGAAALTSRFLMAWLVAWRFARGSRPIRDPELTALTDEMRQRLGLRREVELRSALELRGPATFGWRRPMILLPVGWKLWDRDHLQAALAHELAHIQRGDYLRRAVADVLAAWQWINPLARALAARLRLDQELATDLTALSRAGGRRTYLKALARLALRLDGRTELTEARSFPALGGGTLLRRIEMLRNGGCIERTPAGSSWSLNAFLMGVLTSAVILTLAFRPEWSEPTALAANDPKAATAPEKEKPAPLATAPFDLAYVPDDAMAIVAIRPKTLMKASAPLQTALAAAQPEIAVIMAQAAGFGFDIEEIDQAIAVMPRATNPLLLAEPTALLYSGAVILRSEKPIDIKGVKALGVAIQDATYAGRKYQRTLFEEGLAVAAFRPDEQTLIIASEAALFPFIDRSVQPPRGGDHPLSQAWSAIATKPIAIAVDVGSVRGFAGVMGAEAIGVSMMLAPVSPLWEEVRTHLIGVEISDKIEFETVASCASEAGAESVQATCQSLLTLARNSRKPLVDGYSTLLAADGDGQGPLVQSLIQRAVKPIEEMLSGAKVTREGTVVRYRASIKLDIAALIPLFAM